MHMCSCVQVHHSMLVRLEDNSMRLVFSSYFCVDSGNRIQVTMLVCCVARTLTVKLCYTHMHTHRQTHTHAVLIDKFYLWYDKISS